MTILEILQKGEASPTSILEYLKQGPAMHRDICRDLRMRTFVAGHLLKGLVVRGEIQVLRGGVTIYHLPEHQQEAQELVASSDYAAQLFLRRSPAARVIYQAATKLPVTTYFAAVLAKESMDSSYVILRGLEDLGVVQRKGVGTRVVVWHDPAHTEEALRLREALLATNPEGRRALIRETHILFLLRDTPLEAHEISLKSGLTQPDVLKTLGKLEGNKQIVRHGKVISIWALPGDEDKVEKLLLEKEQQLREGLKQNLTAKHGQRLLTEHSTTMTTQKQPTRAPTPPTPEEPQKQPEKATTPPPPPTQDHLSACLWPRLVKLAQERPVTAPEASQILQAPQEVVEWLLSDLLHAMLRK